MVKITKIHEISWKVADFRHFMTILWPVYDSFERFCHFSDPPTDWPSVFNEKVSFSVFFMNPKMCKSGHFPCFFCVFTPFLSKGWWRVGVFLVFYVNPVSKLSFSWHPWANHTQNCHFWPNPQNPVFNKTRKTRKFSVFKTEESYLILKVQQILGFWLFCLKMTFLSLIG